MAICPSCGKENPDGFEFCGFCTAPLTEQPGSSVQEERKVVSVLFCDLVGFTAASDADGCRCENIRMTRPVIGESDSGAPTRPAGVVGRPLPPLED